MSSGAAVMRSCRLYSSVPEIFWLREVFFTDSGRRLLAESEELFRNERISPGGSADLLSVTAALYLVENKEFPVAII
mgnify:CR=1 FL=1